MTSYKDTLNLLDTPFAMRANARQREPELQAFWAERRIYERLSQNGHGDIFTLHDGPPYANGALHVGHALNKVLKDIINKHALLQGRRARFRPGWDCHGLPIELKVLQTLSAEERQALTPLELRLRARDYALEQVENQRRGFQRWGIWGDWERPYLTLNKEYEAAQIGVFAKMFLSGHIYRGLKPVHWSPSSKTALAESELEYNENHVSRSIFVKFRISKTSEKFQTFLESNNISHTENLFLVIWTTTPWTLPANQAVALNANLNYAIFRDDNGNYFIVSSERIENFSENIQTLAYFNGSILVDTYYLNPLNNENKPVVSADYVSADSGTGLVHNALGHGMDDFMVGCEYQLPIICIVDEKGILNYHSGKFQGLDVLKDANEVIIKTLHESDSILAELEYRHSYPYDWRTKKPVIFRATNQWFASIKNFKQEALDAISSLTWKPSNSFNRIKNMINDRDDWCISRQRTWGVPIPVFYRKDGNEVLCDEESFNHIQKLVEKHGSDVWWEKSENELLPPSRQSESHLWEKGTDTMDVWFDSGTSWASVLEETNYQADLYLEGNDQHRGWFQSSLLTSVATHKTAPYKQVITHGFVIDDNGRKMSKSDGNVIDPMLLVEGNNKKPAYGADVLRLWVCSVDFTNDAHISDEIIKQVSDVYRKIRNTARFMLGSISDFDPNKNLIEVENLPFIDRWILARFSEIVKEVNKHFDNYEFYRIYQIINNFCSYELSNIYFDIAKDRLYVSGKNDFRRRSCQTVLHLLLETLASLIAPILCHMAEDIWQNLPYEVQEDSVFQKGWPVIPDTWNIDATNYTEEIDSLISKILYKYRGEVNSAIENCRSNVKDSNKIGSSLETRITIKLSNVDELHSIKELFVKSIDSLEEWFQVSSVDFVDNPIDEKYISHTLGDEIELWIYKALGIKCERCWHYSLDIGENQHHPTLCGRCVSILSNTN